MIILLKRAASFAAALTASGAAATVAIASDFDSPPSDAEELAVEYVEGRLENPRGASIRATGEPYKVYADFDENEEIEAWAVDVRARMSLRGRTRGAAPYTVIFVDGEPVAIEDDGVDLSTRS